MKRTVLFVALAFASSAAFAGKCPAEIKAIDAAMGKSNLNAQQTEEVKKLRAEGEKLHKEGKHAESMAALGKAKQILKI